MAIVRYDEKPQSSNQLQVEIVRDARLKSDKLVKVDFYNPINTKTYSSNVTPELAKIYKSRIGKALYGQMQVVAVHDGSKVTV